LEKTEIGAIIVIETDIGIKGHIQPHFRKHISQVF